jgi:cobalt-zinc-cadmium efflux system membrane fusion protein
LFEHPDVAQTVKPPKYTDADLARADRALKARPRSSNDPTAARSFQRIQFASTLAVDKAGIEITPAFDLGITEAVSASSEVHYDATTLARMTAMAPGAIVHVFKSEGDPVRRGDVLALIDASEVGRAKSEFLQAVVQLRQRRQTLQDLKSATMVPAAQLREAEAGLREVEIRLLATEQSLANLGLAIRSADYLKLTTEQAAMTLRQAGLPAAIVGKLDERLASANLMPVIAPLNGTVLERSVVAGEVVAANQQLFVVADTRRMWLTLHVSANDAALIVPGLSVKFREDGAKTEHDGKAQWIAASADEKTRLVKARAELPNPTGRIRAGSFGIGRIILREEPGAIIVPKSAVQFDGRCHLVFVRDRDYLLENAPKLFHPRMVRIGAEDQHNVEIIAGLAVGELVATKGSDLLLKMLSRMHGENRVNP